MALNAGYSTTHFHMEIEGFSAGYLSSFQPPSYEAEEAAGGLGPDYLTRKMVGVPKIGEATGVVNISQGGKLLEWIASVWEKKCKHQNTTIHLADQNYKIKRSIEMQDCLITAIEFPELKAAEGKKALEITAKWKPADIHFKAGSGQIQSELGQKAKSWLTANFDVHPVFGLKTNWITSASLPKITAKLATEAYGEMRNTVPLYASIEFGTIKLEIGAQGFDAARDLAVKIIRNGNIEKSADDIIIDMLDQTMKKTLGTFTMDSCLLKKFDWAGKLEGGKDQAAVTTLEFLVEDFRFAIAHK